MERVLFVDDEPILLRAHVRNFEKRYRVETADSGDAALAHLAHAVADGDFPAHWDPKLRIPRGQVVAAASIVSPKY